MNYKKPEWNKGRICSKCGRRFYTTDKQTHTICPKCLYEKMKGNKAND